MLNRQPTGRTACTNHAYAAASCGRAPRQRPRALLVAALAALPLLAACATDYAWVHNDDLNRLQQQLDAQRTEQQEVLASQVLLADTLQQLNATLEQNRELTQAMVGGLQQTLARPLKLDATQIRVVQSAPPPPIPANPGPSVPSDNVSGQKMLVGSVESVWFAQLGESIESRIDTGAESSSLNVQEYEIIERDGQKWVRFALTPEDTVSRKERQKDSGDAAADPDSDDATAPAADAERQVYEQKLVKHVKILQSSTDDKDRRPVIKLRIVIGHIAQEVEFTLADRGHLTYPALIGRNALRDLMIVDVAKKHIATVPDELKTGK